MKLALCKNCGKVFDEEDMDGGYCPGCPAPEIEETIYEPEIDVAKLIANGDCV
jgi:predicted Zn-ribbon and HTH transcriptional regulator